MGGGTPLLTTVSLSGGGARDVQRLPPLAWPALDRVTPPWLANLRPPAMSPHADGTRHPSH